MAKQLDTRSAMRSAILSRGSTSLLPRAAVRYLRPSLPLGWELYFWPRNVGLGRYGLQIWCPQCDERAPKEVKPWNRWRWLAVHVAKHRKPKVE
jgi:hypothetical protein